MVIWNKTVSARSNEYLAIHWFETHYKVVVCSVYADDCLLGAGAAFVVRRTALKGLAGNLAALLLGDDALKSLLLHGCLLLATHEVQLLLSDERRGDLRAGGGAELGGAVGLLGNRVAEE